MISVIIPVRNDNKRLKHTVISIIKSAEFEENLEFVIVDDYSEEKVQREYFNSEIFLKEPSKLVLVRNNKRKGVPKSRNIGAEYASGKVLFLPIRM